MDRDLRLVWLYCVIEDAVRQILGETRLRSRGPTPALTDVEALTIEILGLMYQPPPGAACKIPLA